MSWWTLNMAPYQCRSRAIRFPRLSLNCMLVNEEPCGWYPQKTGMRLVSPLSKRRDQLLLSPVMVNLFFTTGQVVKVRRSEEHTSELQSRGHLVCRLLLEKKK